MPIILAFWEVKIRGPLFEVSLGGKSSQNCLSINKSWVWQHAPVILAIKEI
jgi:hypothetical protein